MFIFRVFLLVLGQSLFWTAEAATKRIKLEAFTITLRPFNDELSLEEATSVRNSVETLLSNFLMDYSWTPGTSVTYVGLARVLENTVSDEAVQLTMDGLVYFSDSSVDIPDSEAMNRLLVKALQPGPLFKAIVEDLAGLESAQLDVQGLSEAPSLSPSDESQGDRVAGIESEAGRQVNANQNEFVTLGAMISGTVLVLIGTFLLVLRVRRSKGSSMDPKDEKVSVENMSSPTKTVDTTEDGDNFERKVRPTSCIGNLFTTGKLQTQMVEDDLSELDFNVDDLVSDFDDTISIQPHIIAVEPVESFEQARTHTLKKDMLDISMGKVNYWGGNGDRTHPCALEPTDVSAATLAVKSSNPRSSTLVPKIYNWSHPRDDIESNDDGTDFAGADWDPDDHSIATDEQSGVFSPTVEDKDEQSLLHHSLRNQSYKMQRLRTPEMSSQDHKDTMESNRNSYHSSVEIL